MRISRRFAIGAGLAALFTGARSNATEYIVPDLTGYRAVQTQYIAALGDPNATSGTGAQDWGIWTVDPGPRGVWLRLYSMLRKAGNIAPAGWRFDIDDWWLDENGLIMKAPDFPIKAGKYVVTGGREHISILTIEPADENGDQAWHLSDGANLNDVTHIPCRSARYTPIGESGTCTPSAVNPAQFPLDPSIRELPRATGCKVKDYHVLIVVALPIA